MVIAVQLDDSVDSKSAIRDIRDPSIIKSLMFLGKNLRSEILIRFSV